MNSMSEKDCWRLKTLVDGGQVVVYWEDEDGEFHRVRSTSTEVAILSGGIPLLLEDCLSSEFVTLKPTRILKELE